MNTPSYNALLQKDKLIKTVQELCENSNKTEQAVSKMATAFEVTDTGDVYVMGIGGYDGTNADDPETKTLQQVLEDLAG